MHLLVNSGVSDRTKSRLASSDVGLFLFLGFGGCRHRTTTVLSPRPHGFWGWGQLQDLFAGTACRASRVGTFSFVSMLISSIHTSLWHGHRDSIWIPDIDFVKVEMLSRIFATILCYNMSNYANATCREINLGTRRFFWEIVETTESQEMLLSVTILARYIFLKTAEQTSRSSTFFFSYGGGDRGQPSISTRRQA